MFASNSFLVHPLPHTLASLDGFCLVLMGTRWASYLCFKFISRTSFTPSSRTMSSTLNVPIFEVTSKCEKPPLLSSSLPNQAMSSAPCVAPVAVGVPTRAQFALAAKELHEYKPELATERIDEPYTVTYEYRDKYSKVYKMSSK